MSSDQTSRTETFDVVLRVTARNLSRAEANEQGFELEDAEEFGDDYFDPKNEPIARFEMAECIAGSFHDEAISEALAGSGLLSTIDKVSLVRVEPASDVDERQRAEAYYCNLVALIFSTRCELTAYVRDHGETMVTATLRNRLRTLIVTVEQVEAGEYHSNCEACGKPLLDGQQVIFYDDAGDVHADCDQPETVSADPPSHVYDSGYSPEECAAELEKAKAVLAEVDGEGEA